MNKSFLSLVFIVTVFSAPAQDSADSIQISLKRNSINLNLFGGVAIVSANYERLFPVKDWLLISGQLGVGNALEIPNLLNPSQGPKPENYTAIPHHVTGIFGRKRNGFEAGLGGTTILGPPVPNEFVYLLLGYRHKPVGPDYINFRIYASLPFFFNFNGQNEAVWYIPLGITLGRYF
jgi:hypothetical protein